MTTHPVPDSPPADLRAAVLAAVADAAAADTTPTVTEPARRRPSPRRSWRIRIERASGPAFALCSLVLAVMLASEHHHNHVIHGQLVALTHQVGDLEDRPDLAVFNGITITKLHTEGPFGGARGQIAINYDTGIVAFKDVPAPPTGKVWQVWQVTDDDTITSLGTIDRAARARVLALHDVDEGSLRKIMVTVEAGAGTSRPSPDTSVAEHDFA